MRHTTSLLLAALVLSPARADGPSPVCGEAAYAVPLHKLTEASAHRLDGRRGLFYVRVKDRLPSPKSQEVCVCKSADGAFATVWMLPGRHAADVMVVEATFHVYRRLGYLLDDAVRVERDHARRP